MKKYCLIVSLALAGVLPAAAQEDYRPGYVVTHAGDTLKGGILFKNGLGKHESCTFKDVQGNITTYKPAAITAYGFAGSYYYEGIASAEKFMEVLTLGRLDLLAVVGNLFLRDSAGTIHPLESITKTTEKEGTTHIYEQKEYLGVLRWLMADCSKVQSRINNTALKFGPIMKLVTQYNDCVGEKQVMTQGAVRKERPWRVGVIFMYSAGSSAEPAEHTQIHLSTGTTVLMGELADPEEFSSITAFSYGLYFNGGLARVHERLSFSIEALMQQYELSSSRAYEGSSTRTYHNSISQKIRSIKVPLYIQYEWTGRKRVQPLLFFGVSANFNDTADSGMISGETEEGPSGHFTVTRHYQDVLSVQAVTLSVLGGAGLTTKVSDRLSLELKGRYEYGGGPLRITLSTSRYETQSHTLFSASLSCRYRL